MTPQTIQAKAMRVASATLKKMSSEKTELLAKTKEAEAKLASALKEAEARKLAMLSILDPEYIDAIEEKTAAFAKKDLNVVKEALTLQGSINSIGTKLSEVKIASSGNELLDYIQEVLSDN